MLRSLQTTLVLATLTGGLLGQTTISDVTFDPADWTATLLTSNGNGGTMATSQVLAGGNPDAFRQVDHTILGAPSGSYSAIGVFHAYEAQPYDPAVSGPVAAIDFTVDTIQFNPPFSGSAGHAIYAAVRQNGQVFLGSGQVLAPETAWTPKAITGLTATRFNGVSGSGHPDFSATGAPFVVGYWTANSTCVNCGGYATSVGYDNFRIDLLPAVPTLYCTAGTSASGCRATLSAAGLPSASAPSGFTVTSTNVEGKKIGHFLFGQNGRRADPWGNGTSFHCVVPPLRNGGLLPRNGTKGACDGGVSQDLNARWCPTCPKSADGPVPGTYVQVQFWYRDPFSTSNRTTSLSDALEVMVLP